MQLQQINKGVIPPPCLHLRDQDKQCANGSSTCIVEKGDRSGTAPLDTIASRGENGLSKKKGRINWIDAGKCIGILMVMFGHNWLHPRYCFYIYAFHMPLFFILAGYTFSAKQNIFNFIIKKAKALLIPYVTFALVSCVFYLLLNVAHTGQLHLTGMAEKYLLRGTETLLWFLPTLFLAEISTYVIVRLHFTAQKTAAFVTLAVLLILAYLMTEYCTIDYNLIGCISLIPLATAFIICGIIYNNYIEGSKLEGNWIYISLINTMAIALAICNCKLHNFTTMFDTGNFLIFVVVAILATYGLILILRKITFSPWFLYIGISSIVFYGLHRIVIEVCFLIYGYLSLDYDKVSAQSVLMASLNVIIACAVIYPISLFIDKRCPWLIGKF